MCLHTSFCRNFINTSLPLLFERWAGQGRGLQHIDSAKWNGSICDANAIFPFFCLSVSFPSAFQTWDCFCFIMCSIIPTVSLKSALKHASLHGSEFMVSKKEYFKMIKWFKQRREKSSSNLNFKTFLLLQTGRQRMPLQDAAALLRFLAPTTCDTCAW